MSDASADEIVVYVVAALKSERVSKGMSQVRLAELSGISRSGLGHIEGGRVSPSFTNVLRLCEALEMDIVKLIDKARSEVRLSEE